MSAVEDMKQRYFDKHGKDATQNKTHFIAWLCSGIRQHEKTITSLSMDRVNDITRLQEVKEKIEAING